MPALNLNLVLFRTCCCGLPRPPEWSFQGRILAFTRLAVWRLGRGRLAGPQGAGRPVELRSMAPRARADLAIPPTNTTPLHAACRAADVNMARRPRIRGAERFRWPSCCRPVQIPTSKRRSQLSTPLMKRRSPNVVAARRCTWRSGS